MDLFESGMVNNNLRGSKPVSYTHLDVYKRQGKLDGISGSGTKAAIKKFQRVYGLSVDGIWGTKTNAKAVSVTKELQTCLLYTSWACKQCICWWL